MSNQPVSPPDGLSDSSIPSGDANHSAWGTNLDTNPNHPVHFDSRGNCENPITATYFVAPYPNYDDGDNDSHLYTGEKSIKSSNIFDVRNYSEPKSKDYSFWYHTKLDAQPPAGLIDCHVATYYCQEITFLDNKQKKQKFCTKNIKCCEFIIGMSQTYRNLTSLDEPDIFDINKDQKHTLNQLIHTALINWEACQIRYCEHCSSDVKKNSTFCFIPRPWKKVESPAYSTNYVQSICNETTQTQGGTASCRVQKNN